MNQDTYHLLYYLLLLFFFFIGAICQQFKNNRYDNFPFCLLISIILAIFVGSRNLYIGSDTLQYSTLFQQYSQYNLINISEYFKFGGEPLFKFAYKIIGLFFSYQGAMVISSLTFLCLTYFFARGAVKLNGDGSIVIMFLCLLFSFVSWNEQVNIIRSGIGIGFLLLFLLSLYKKTISWTTFIYAICAIGTHFSTGIFIILAIVAKYLNSNIYIYVYILSLGLAYFGYSILNLGIFSSIDFEKAQSYITNLDSSSYETGFRLIFALYNTCFFLFVWKLRKYLSDFNKLVFRFYILASILFFFWFTIPYSDRIGAFSWTVIPVLYYLPLTCKFKRNKLLPVGAVILYGFVSFFV